MKDRYQLSKMRDNEIREKQKKKKGIEKEIKILKEQTEI